MRPSVVILIAFAALAVGIGLALVPTPVRRPHSGNATANAARYARLRFTCPTGPGSSTRIVGRRFEHG
jgi:hypothetical protein